MSGEFSYARKRNAYSGIAMLTSHIAEWVFQRQGRSAFQKFQGRPTSVAMPSRPVA